MRVILSRKGFDSQYGGVPNIITGNDLMLPLPIPYIKSLDSDGKDDTFSSVRCADGVTPADHLAPFSAKLCKEIRGEELSEVPCHLDPDLYEGAKGRSDGWRGCFGQEGAALGHLLNRKHQVTEGDLFLFFGLFCEEERLSVNRARHIAYGYLQVDRFVDLSGKSLEERKRIDPEWARDHPHVCDGRHGKRGRNGLFIARETASWDPSLKGWGIFKYSPELELTKAGMSCSRWDPEKVGIFRRNEPSYHGAKCWKTDENGREYFQSRTRGQEFVFEDEPDDGPILQWAKDIIDIGMGRA